MPECDGRVRVAGPEDVDFILRVICVLAEYEKAADQVEATPQMLHECLFEKGVAHCLIAADSEGRDVGIALYYHSFSTWQGRPGIYLEDLCVLPEYRGQGFGTALLQRLAHVALDEGCGRFEWSCLDWNTPSIGFYEAIGAEPLDGWTRFRMEGETLKALAMRDTTKM